MSRLKVLFVCVGNSCRSQMAEGFARTYGSDVLEPYSAGLAPALLIAPETRKVMLERNIDIASQFPKPLERMDATKFDIVVNISGYPLPLEDQSNVREWMVRDPIGKKEKFHREIRDEVEHKVMGLILELRAKAAAGI